MLRLLSIIILLALLAGCSTPEEGRFEPTLNPPTKAHNTLRSLPGARNKVVVAVYDFSDQTGQFAPSDKFQSLSKAVTQGAAAILVKALQDAGDQSWFTVVERENLKNLLKERQIISEMRRLYLGEKGVNQQALPPLLLAGIILEGGVVGYDSNTLTGGAGARYLAIGGDVKYRQDTVTIYLRAVSTKTGEVLANVTTHKTVVSTALQGDVFKFISYDKLLEMEAGITKNEPKQLAVQQAIEKAVYSLVIEGADKGLWEFRDPQAQWDLVAAYRAEKEDPPGISRWQTNVEKHTISRVEETAATE